MGEYADHTATERERFEAWFRLKYLCAPAIESNLEALGRWQAWQARAALAPAVPQWPMRGARVDGDTVVISVKGGNDAARWLCGELVAGSDMLPAVKPGWALVPVEPTPEMRAAFHACTDDVVLGASGSKWAAMIAAAPSAKEPT